MFCLLNRHKSSMIRYIYDKVYFFGHLICLTIRIKGLCSIILCNNYRSFASIALYVYSLFKRFLCWEKLQKYFHNTTSKYYVTTRSIECNNMQGILAQFLSSCVCLRRARFTSHQKRVPLSTSLTWETCQINKHVQ